MSALQWSILGFGAAWWLVGTVFLVLWAREHAGLRFKSWIDWASAAIAGAALGFWAPKIWLEDRRRGR